MNRRQLYLIECGSNALTSSGPGSDPPLAPFDCEGNMITRVALPVWVRPFRGEAEISANLVG
jgi:hypothetical protein